jgi:hypothetical protein
MLISVRKINRLNLDEAIEKQQIFKRKIGEILIMMGLLNPEELDLYLMVQREVYGKELEEVRLDPEVLKKTSVRRLFPRKRPH